MMGPETWQLQAHQDGTCAVVAVEEALAALWLLVVAVAYSHSLISSKITIQNRDRSITHYQNPKVFNFLANRFLDD